MYSGSDSTESQTHTQWALNPSAYRNVSNDQVDWAALAQQWIIMKEAGPPVPEQTLKPTKPLNLKEEGEAPMEVERDEGTPTSAGSQQGSDAWNWGQQQQGWNWGASWNVAPTGVPPPAAVKAPLLPTPGGFGQFGGISEGAVDAVAFNASFPSTTTNEYTSGYWTGNSTKIKPHNKRYSKVNVPIQAPTHEPVALDAAKRKQLPAWIREGLEKMERDKQKQLEREREMQQEKEEKVEKVKFTEKDALEIIKSTVKERQKSRFDSDGEDSVHSGTDTKAATPEPPVTPLSQEELLMKVRRMMTEVLLKVTNREIYQICKEELQRHHKKSRASDHRVPASSGNNTSSRLGLGMYGGDSDDSSATEDSVDTKGAENRDYSDSELKDSIKRRKAQFSKTEKEIEERLAEKDHKGNAENRHSTPPERNQNDSQVDAKSQAAKRRHSASNDKTPPPKSTTPEARRRPSRKHSSTSTEDDTDSDRGRNSKKSKKSKRSSSSDSDSNHRSQRKKLTESGRKTSRRSRSRSRSRTRKGTMRSRSRSKRRSRSSNRSDLRKRSRRSRSRSTSRRRSRSRSPHGRSKRRSRSRRRRSDSRSSRRSYRYRRSRSSSSGRGKRSHRH